VTMKMTLFLCERAYSRFMEIVNPEPSD